MNYEIASDFVLATFGIASALTSSMSRPRNDGGGVKVSIITVVYNDVKYIEDCIKSVLSQSYRDIEYIIIDGSSTDGTLEIINKYKDRISKIVSEKDKGHIYAMNKGLKLATGEVVGFLHSDDFYVDDGVLERIANLFKNKSLDTLYGNLLYVRKDNPEKIIRYWRGGEFDFEKLKRGWMPPHPTFFVRREIYEKYGFLNTDFKISVDYELILRLLYKHRLPSFYLPEAIVKMRWGGVSNKSVKNIIKKTIEDYKACRMYGLGIWTMLMKNVIKIPQFFTRS